MRPLLVLPLLIASLSAAVHSVQITERTPVDNGKAFGHAGAYEKLSGRATFKVDPRLPANRIVTDLQYAKPGRDGFVEFAADIVIFKPRDPAKGNGSILFEVSNRGGRGLLNTFSYGKGKDDAGDGFLFEQGYTLVWVAWQFDVPAGRDLLTLSVPAALGRRGLVRSEAEITARQSTIGLADGAHMPYPAEDPNDQLASLTVREFADGPRTVIDRKQWQFTNATTVALDGGFEPGKRYEVIYMAKDPAIAGLGSVAIRDFISYLKHGGPAAGGLEEQHKYLKRAIGWGSSQSGRYLRDFVYQGFNADEQGRIVFEGLMPHIAGAGRGSFHHRFAQPSRLAPWISTAVFPFRDLDETDGEVTDGILRVAAATGTVPKIFYTNTSHEYWRSSASLLHTDATGAADAPLAPTTRIYFLTGTQHGPGSWPPPRPAGLRYAANPNDYRPLIRALLAAMNDWIGAGKEPPPSRYPANNPAELAPAAELRFPRIPEFAAPSRVWRALRVDFGPAYRMAGVIDNEPPQRNGPAFGVKQPQVDKDGNEVAGVKNPVQMVPLGTYFGWNLAGGPEIAGGTGSYIPFAKTREDRERSGDPRLSIAERYAGREEYLDKVTAAARRLVKDRYLLDRDVARVRERAAAEWTTLMDR